MNDSTINFTMKQMVLFAAMFVSLMFGALFWATTSDTTGKIIGVVFMGIGLILVVPLSLERDKTAADRRFLRTRGRRVDARIAIVHNDGSFQGASYFRLELYDPIDEKITFMSDPLRGGANDVEHVLELSRQRGVESQMTISVYVDPNDVERYFVDASNNIAQVLQARLS